MRGGFVAIDWGSSNFRAYRVGASGELLDRLVTAEGVANLDRDGMARALEAVVSRWPTEANALFCCGMIGSTVGWAEVPYLTCPIHPNEIARQMTAMTIAGNVVRVSPGLTCRSTDGFPDVIRGEEVLCLGVVRTTERLQSGLGLLCMPGTHTKWIAIRNGVVGSFSTSLVGELYEALSASSLLKNHLKGVARDDGEFRLGVNSGHSGGGLMRTLFGVRSRSVVRELADDAAASFASGILIGNDIRDAMNVYSELVAAGPVVLIGETGLCALYRAALQHLGHDAVVTPSEDVCVEGFKFIHDVIGRGPR